jgi:hypothetical protein
MGKRYEAVKGVPSGIVVLQNVDVWRFDVQPREERIKEYDLNCLLRKYSLKETELLQWLARECYHSGGIGVPRGPTPPHLILSDAQLPHALSCDTFAVTLRHSRKPAQACAPVD